MFEGKHVKSVTNAEPVFGDPLRPDVEPGVIQHHRSTLKDFVDYPIDVSEIQSKGDYYAHFHNNIANALILAGYEREEVDQRIKLSLEKIDYNRPPEVFVADINRIIHNFLQIAPPIMSTVAAIVPSGLSPTSEPLSGVTDKKDVPKAESLSGAASFSVSEMQQQLEQPELGKQKYEVKSTERKIIPSRIEPQFPVIPGVNKSPEIVLQNIAQITSKAPEGELESVRGMSTDEDVKNKTVALESQPLTTPTPSLEQNVIEELVDTAKGSLKSQLLQQLESLNEQPFDRAAYLEFTFEKHSELRAKYDAVIQKARENLKRYSALYTPSKTEKEALQFLSSLQGQYARMQKADSETGIRRAELVNSLNRTDKKTSEEEVKKASENFVEQIDKIFSGITKLDVLIDEAIVEEKPPLAEAYRTQLESMRIEGDKILATVPKNHPLYTTIHELVTEDLVKLVEFASPEKGGDKKVLEESSMFIANRDRIKSMFTFIKQEHEYQDYFARARAEVQKLESQFERILNSENSEVVQKVLAENIIKIKEALSKTTPQITIVGALENLETQQNTIRGLLGESRVMLKSLPVGTFTQTESGELTDLSDENMYSLLEVNTVAQTIRVNLEKYKNSEPVSSSPLDSAAELHRHEAFRSPVLNERIKKIVALISPKKVGRVAALGAMLASVSPDNSGPLRASNSQQEAVVSILPTELVPSVESFNEAELYTYLRSIKIEKRITPKLPAQELVPTSVISELKKADLAEEVVSGVILHDSGSSVSELPIAKSLEIFSDKADNVPLDTGVIFSTPLKNQENEPILKPYTVKNGDVFWSEADDHAIATQMPVMQEVHPDLKRALIGLTRDYLNLHPDTLTKIGGFGQTVADLVIDEEMNLELLNHLMRRIAVDTGYLR